MSAQVLSIEEIRIKFPAQWVLIGNPLLDESFVGSITSKLKSGVVLLSAKERKELGQHANAARQGYETIACIYTGTFSIAGQRRWIGVTR